MAKITISQITKRKYRKSQVTKDKNGKIHCKTCGAFISGRGKKKNA